MKTAILTSKLYGENPLATAETREKTAKIKNVKNTGNIPINISVNGTALWTTAELNTIYYRFKAANISTEPFSFDWKNSKTLWQNVTAAESTAITDLQYQDSYDEARIDINVKVPSLEPPGAKNSTINIRASQTG